MEPWAFDGDADDKVSESHCSDGTNCIAGVGGPMMSFDYIDDPSARGNCSGCCCYCYYSWDDSRCHYRHVRHYRADYFDDAATTTTIVAVAAGLRYFQPALDFDSAPVRVLAKPADPRSWNCSVSRLIPAAVPE